MNAACVVSTRIYCSCLFSSTSTMSITPIQLQSQSRENHLCAADATSSNKSLMSLVRKQVPMVRDPSSFRSLGPLARNGWEVGCSAHSDLKWIQAASRPLWYRVFRGSTSRLVSCPEERHDLPPPHTRPNTARDAAATILVRPSGPAGRPGDSNIINVQARSEREGVFLHGDTDQGRQDCILLCGMPARIQNGPDSGHVCRPNLTLTVPMQVQSGGSFDVDYEVTGPNGKYILDGQKERQGDFVFTAQEAGEYKFCFNNEMSTYSEKFVDFEIAVRTSPDTPPTRARAARTKCHASRSRTRHAYHSPPSRAPLPSKHRPSRSRCSRSRARCRPSRATRNTSAPAKTATSAPSAAQRRGSSTSA